MKKILSLVLAILLLVSATCLVGCGGDSNSNGSTNKPAEKDAQAEALVSEIGGASETFVGTLSEEKYASAEEAAQAYVAEEVVGEKEAEILDTKSNGTLSDKEIKKAGIPDSLLANADAVEELEITYSVSDGTMDGGVTLLAETLNTKKTVKVYVIKCGVDWQYFTPCPVTGDTITKSYYDSVFNSEKYKNCTLKTSMTVKAKTKASFEGESMNLTTEMVMEQLIKFADGKIYLESTTKTNDELQGINNETKIYAYMETVDGKVDCYVKTEEDGEWYRGSLTSIGFSTLDELTPFSDQYLDYTYFKKTDYGFSLSDENARSYFEQALSDVAGALADMITGDMDFDMLAKYVVQEGVLSAMIIDAKIVMNMNEQGVKMNIDETISGKTTCTNYGTTVVEKPFTE